MKNDAKHQVYGNVHQAVGTEVYNALRTGDRKLAKKLFEVNTEKYKTQYSEEDRKWFADVAKEFKDKSDSLHDKTCGICK